MLSTFLALVIWAVVAQQDAGAQSPPAGDLATAKTLYASGDYEEALATLSTAKAGDSLDEVDEYRSLCLLALGRTAEAQQSLETLVTRNPLFKMSDADVSPRLVTIFHDVRKRLLPGAVRDLYEKGKANFEQGHYDVAKPQFEQLMTLLSDDDLGQNAASLADLKILADGFLKLANAQLAAKAEAARAPARVPDKPAEHTSEETPPSAPPEERAYSADDKEVTPPVDVSCPLPEWHPLNSSQMREYHGVLRIVIDAQGKVESSAVLVPAHPAYDPLLLAAVKDWQYKPALRNGQPVKYQKLIPFTLKPRER
ncbi:MAG TPA: TonB family protein [Vicinamibacterales bacterium]|nr:TonB family protein [Vicinamibacterales bacterium]